MRPKPWWAVTWCRLVHRKKWELKTILSWEDEVIPYYECQVCGDIWIP